MVYKQISDQTSGNTTDPKLQEISKQKGPYTMEEILEKIWKGDFFRFDFTIKTLNTSSIINTTTKQCYVKAKDLFNIKKVEVEYQHSTWLRHSKYWYKVADNDLEPKWADVSSNNIIIMGEPWDLSNKSMIVSIETVEYDDNQSSTKSLQYSVGFTFTSSSEFSYNNSGYAQKVSLGYSVARTIAQTLSITTTAGSDDMRSAELRYFDPIIRSQDSKGYKVNTISSGSIELMILPKRY